MNLNSKENEVAHCLLTRVYSDIMTTSTKSGISEAVLTDYIVKMLGYCCIIPEDKESMNYENIQR